MYKCPKCGQVFEGEARFCPNCGQPFVYPAEDEGNKALHVYVHHVHEETSDKAEEAPEVEEPVEEKPATPSETGLEPVEKETPTLGDKIRRSYVASVIWGIVANLVTLAGLIVSAVLVPVIDRGFINNRPFSHTADAKLAITHLIERFNDLGTGEDAIVHLVTEIVPIAIAAIGGIFALVSFFVLIAYAARPGNPLGKIAIREANHNLKGKKVTANVLPASVLVAIGTASYNLISMILILLRQGDEHGYPMIDYKFGIDQAGNTRYGLVAVIAIALVLLGVLLSIISACSLARVKKQIARSVLAR